MKNHLSLLISPSLKQAYESKAAGTKSREIEHAINKAYRQPLMLSYALAHRIGREAEENTEKTSTNLDQKTIGFVEELAKASGLPNIQVIRLAMEAHVYKL